MGHGAGAVGRVSENYAVGVTDDGSKGASVDSSPVSSIHRNDREGIELTSRTHRRSWLRKYAARDTGLWAIYFKKQHINFLSNDAMFDECFCVGWADCQPRKLDNDRAMLCISPRKILVQVVIGNQVLTAAKYHYATKSIS